MGGECNTGNNAHMIAMEPESGKLVKLGEPNKNNTSIIKLHIFATVVISN